MSHIYIFLVFTAIWGIWDGSWPRGREHRGVGRSCVGLEIRCLRFYEVPRCLINPPRPQWGHSETWITRLNHHLLSKTASISGSVQTRTDKSFVVTVPVLPAFISTYLWCRGGTGKGILWKERFGINLISEFCWWWLCWGRRSRSQGKGRCEFVDSQDSAPGGFQWVGITLLSGGLILGCGAKDFTTKIHNSCPQRVLILNLCLVFPWELRSLQDIQPLRCFNPEIFNSMGEVRLIIPNKLIFSSSWLPLIC